MEILNAVNADASLDSVLFDDEAQTARLETNDKALAVGLAGLLLFVGGDSSITVSEGDDEVFTVEASDIERAAFFGALASAMLIREACNTAHVIV